ncbi:DUF4389 domain-containing protein [Streptomyces finlayi]|uniref:DUF4389 domain-containing protein n=1 Tax=Streptomyces finlayi TaxID=67296 RepID=A0A7G7BU84_9ACTN|nr:DUF4389 domain-containing protein [Streptomyces finlayi]QNE78899.1 DUF4389 domain-containing protein [Streptomyces finlayi]
MVDGQWSPGRVAGDPDEFLPVLDVIEPTRQRRLTVLLRLLLLIPHFLVLFVLYIAAVFAVIFGWFAALVLGRLPGPVFTYLEQYLGYHMRVSASEMLLVDRYPPFALTPPPDYPVQIEVRPTDLNRLAVLFRVFLMIPAAVVQALATSGWFALSFIWWVITLILGRMPRPLFDATAATLRYQMRLFAYAMMLTPAYPRGLFGDDDLSGTGRRTRSATRPLIMSGAAKGLVVLFLVCGLLSGLGSSTATWSSDGTDDFSSSVDE